MVHIITSYTSIDLVVNFICLYIYGTMFIKMAMSHSKDFRMIYWNCRDVGGKFPEIQHLSGKYNIICLQETLKNRKFQIRNFNIIRLDQCTNKNRGICIMINSEISVSSIDLSHIGRKSIEVVGVVINLKPQPMLLLSVYRHPNTFTPNRIFEEIFNLQNKFSFMMVMRDFNAHHIVWGDRTSDPVGRRLLDEIMEAGFIK